MQGRSSSVRDKRGPVLLLALRYLDLLLDSFPVEVVSGLGAGDAFGGSICHGLVEGWPLVDAARFGNAAGAIVASRLMCADDMPTTAEVEELMGAGHAAR